MATPDNSKVGLVFLLAAISDIIVGLGLAAAPRIGLIDADPTIMGVVGLVIASAGVGLGIVGLIKMKQGRGLGGNRN